MGNKNMDRDRKQLQEDINTKYYTSEKKILKLSIS